MIAAAAERDAGFEVTIFAEQLAGVRRITPADVDRYGVTAEQLEGIKARCLRWAADLYDRPSRDQPGGGRIIDELRGQADEQLPVRPSDS